MPLFTFKVRTFLARLRIPGEGVWSGTAQSYVDLHPSGFTESWAYGTNGKQQVGYGYGTLTGGSNNALLGSGTAQSCVDLNPSGDNPHAGNRNTLV